MKSLRRTAEAPHATLPLAHTQDTPPIALVTDLRMGKSNAAGSETTSHSGIGTYFALTLVGLVFATLCKAALAWDGAPYLFQLLDSQALVVPNNRLIHVPLQLPVLLLSHFTKNLDILQVGFGLAYAMMPFLALVASWWVTRERARHLFVWAVLGIGLGTLPGQFDFASEAKIAVALFWPLLLILLTRTQKAHATISTLLILAVLCSHPFAIGLFAFAGILAFFLGLRDQTERRRLWLSAVGFGAMTMIAALRFWLFRSSYEAGQMSLEVLRNSFDEAVAGLPLLALSCAWLAAFAVMAAPFTERLAIRWLRSVTYAFALLCLAAAGGIFLFWASDPHRWQSAISFKTWVLLCSLPFMAMAAVDSCAQRRNVRPSAQHDEGHQRTRIAQTVGLIFALTLIVQSTAWVGLTARLRDTMVRSPWHCVSAGPAEGINGTPLDHWSIATRSILLQGQNPQQIVLNNDSCGEVNFADSTYLYRYLDTNFVRSRLARGSGWFNIDRLNQQLRSDRGTAAPCSFQLTTGWHLTETTGPYWWRWSDGRAAQMRATMDRADTIILYGQIETARAPNQLRVLVNGQQQGTLDLPTTGLHPIDLPPLSLRAGSNTIQLVSQNPPVPANTDGRLLGLSISNLTMVRGMSEQPCAFQP